MKRKETVKDMEKKVLLIIGFVWPEPNSSAAGYRMLQLIKAFNQMGFNIHFASPNMKTEYAFNLQSLQVETHHIEVNHSNFDAWVKALSPNVVMFDRFIMEEQFGWRIAEFCPKAIRVLDTEDLHCLRKVRAHCVKKKIEFSEQLLLESDVTKREIASISRSHLSLMISTFEMKLLENTFQISKNQLLYFPFISDCKIPEAPAFNEREHFMTIGSFRHQPNVDSVLFLKQKIWPKIRIKLPEAEIHIYGSYPKQQVTELHDPKTGFIVKGWAKDAHYVIRKSRVLLAPLRYGAGIKGKFFDALMCKTPSITTSVGAEGMPNEKNWLGIISDDVDDIVEQAVKLYSNENMWNRFSSKADDIISQNFDSNLFIPNLEEALRNSEKQSFSFQQTMLNFHSFKNSKYMSKWIEEKSKGMI
ncbi:MAG: glycosyltransferase [Flavobacteriales bacterium]